MEELTLMFAKIFAIYFLIAGLALLINMKSMSKMLGDLGKNKVVLWSMGAFVLLFGLWMVTSHNIWEGTAETIITVIGWLALLKGAVIMLFPDAMIRLGKSCTRSGKLMTFGGVVVLIVGIALFYLSWLA